MFNMAGALLEYTEEEQRFVNLFLMIRGCENWRNLRNNDNSMWR